MYLTARGGAHLVTSCRDHIVNHIFGKACSLILFLTVNKKIFVVRLFSVSKLKSWTKLLRKFRKNTIKLLTIIFTHLCEPPFPHS